MNSEWLRVPLPRPGAGLRLVCLPHAGGSAGFFTGWANRVDPEVEIVSVAYPGRADRLLDDLCDDLVEMAADIAQAVVTADDRPVALFGHSLGAVAALEVARALQSLGAPLVHLFASGSRNGDVEVSLTLPNEDPDDVIDELVRLGGTDPEIARDPAFRELIVPYVVGDVRMLHGYHMTPAPILDCDVTTIVGSDDADADRRPWSALTRGRFTEHDVLGGHFYLIDSPPFSVLSATLRQPAVSKERFS
jgi:surfactin synthase thioesterase subunit